ncbi:MAG: hypothetical protein C0594_08255 [Marinilabiliales bacterium]|nr:MAG: hypothetical protein C0594_08255 [Marinilabiliales bacterium]
MTEQTNVFKGIICSQCSGKLEFKPGQTSMVCPYCGKENAIEVQNDEVEELDFSEYLDKLENEAEATDVFHVKCDACGADVELEENIVSDDCAFCGTPIVSKNGSHGKVIKPKAVLPFQNTRKEAKTSYKTWLKKLWFAPSGLAKSARQTEKLNGMYIPYWTYDTQTTTSYSGERGDNYTEQEQYTNDKGETQTRTVTKTRWMYASGVVRKFFNDILVIASNTLPIKYLRKLEPWDLSKLVNFEASYITGFKTEVYQVGLKEGFEMVKKEVDKPVKELIRKDIGGDKQRIHRYNIKFSEITFKHILLPVWISAYRYNGKVYRFLVNGSTGEVQGERPYSFWKIFFFVVGILALVGGSIAIYYYLNQEGS